MRIAIGAIAAALTLVAVLFIPVGVVASISAEGDYMFLALLLILVGAVVATIASPLWVEFYRRTKAGGGQPR